jgi:energy-coupling factor transport system permease protein
MKKQAAFLDPRVVFAFVVFVSSFSIIFRTPEKMLPVFLCALCVMLCMKINLAQLFIKLRRLWYVIFFVALLQGVFNPSGTILVRAGGITLVTAGGIRIALAVLMRLSMLIMGGAMLARYRNRVLIQAMLQLNLPAEVAYMVSIGIRFIPLIAETLRDSLTAIALRGVDFSTLKFSKRLKVYTYILMPSIAQTINTARQTAAAMELRGFRAFEKRTSFFTLKMKTQDWCFLGATIIFSVASAVLSRVAVQFF